MDNIQTMPLGKAKNLPDFIIIGEQKSGTTALRHNLDKHPDIYMAVLDGGGSDEPQFFTNKNWEKGLSWYSDLFQQFDKVQGEKTPDILSNKIAITRMAQTVPDAKLIVLLRNPITRAYSAWNHFNQIIDISQNWGWQIGSFEEAIDLAKQKKNPYANLFNKGNYITHIKNLLKYFPREQVFIGIAERFKQHPDEQMKKVFDFLGVVHMDIEPEIKHKRKYQEKMKPETEKSLERLFELPNKRLFDFLGDDIPEWRGEVTTSPQIKRLID